jgi:hypothetical protein
MSNGTGAHDPSVAEDGDTSPAKTLGRRMSGTTCAVAIRVGMR